MVQANFPWFQKGARRFQAAMSGIPDRVPVCAQLHEFAMNETGATAKDFYTNAQSLVAGTLETQQKYGIDVPVLDYDVYNIEAEAIGQKMMYSQTDMPDVDRTCSLIRDRKDLKKIQTPDFDTQGRFAHVIEMNKLFRKQIGGETEVSLQFCAPFSLAANIRGFEQLIMDMYTDPDFARDLFGRIVEELLIPWILRLKKEFPNATGICGSDASGSLPIVNTDILKEWIIPYILRLRDVCGPQVYVPNWVGESHLKHPDEMLDLKRQVCPGFVEGQDPDVANLGPERYKQYAQKHNLPLILGVGAAFLAASTPAEVGARVHHYLEVGGKNGRFALLLCNLGATTPPENVKAAVATVRQFGVYNG
ncbi:MAG: uroporphyrinogen decarboxylase family protein [Desulfobacterales bacterium]